MVLSGCSRPSSNAKSVALRLASCTPPVFVNVTKALVTSPMPCVTSMLVLQPNTSTEMDGPLGRFVRDGVSEIKTKGVLEGDVNVLVAMEILGVADATPITTGVGVNMDGVGVAGRNGVGGLPGNG